jgi:hypothetical protein
MGMEPVMREFMPDIALGVSVMSLREQHMADMEREGPHSPMGPAGHHMPHGPCPSARLGHAHGPGHGHSCKLLGSVFASVLFFVTATLH